jgi:hypothetical protein
MDKNLSKQIIKKIFSQNFYILKTGLLFKFFLMNIRSAGKFFQKFFLIKKSLPILYGVGSDSK